MNQTHIVECEIELDIMADTPENACSNYDVCGNVVPHRGKMCGDCLADLRHEDSGYDL